MKLMKNNKYLQQNVQKGTSSWKYNIIQGEAGQELCPFYMYGHAFYADSSNVLLVKNNFDVSSYD